MNDQNNTTLELLKRIFYNCIVEYCNDTSLYIITLQFHIYNMKTQLHKLEITQLRDDQLRVMHRDMEDKIRRVLLNDRYPQSQYGREFPRHPPFPPRTRQQDDTVNAIAITASNVTLDEIREEMYRNNREYMEQQYASISVPSGSRFHTFMGQPIIQPVSIVDDFPDWIDWTKELTKNSNKKKNVKKIIL